MSRPQFHRLEWLFQAAVDLPEAERRDFLERECGDDAELRREVEGMLANAGKDSLPVPAVGPAAGIEGVAIEGPGTTIDRYKLLQAIGEGGFGVVYMAEQQEPVVRRVALKIIKLGMDTKEVVARFEAERQALALMEHPNIAKVLDGGATQTGRPYFVMELVRGISITEYCDKNSLPTRERLELFLQVCHAVEHAHQKGVIHRDLKPTNVLVTLHDGKPVPKVIDFGIAKAMHSRLTEKTLFTAFERFIGTPAYMSPEQAEMSGLDIDTRSDVYSLGILLYELLTGTTPFDIDSVMREGLAEVKRVIREEPAPRPSLRISTTDDASIATNRRSDVRALSRRLRGDLDWIVMRALEKERVRRYGTVSELAADIRRHLDNAPVAAGPPSRIYRARKFLTRNRAAAASVSLISLVLIGGIIGTSAGMWEASQQRDEALSAREQAQRETERARAVTDFLVEAIALADPQFALSGELSVRQLLDRSASQVENAFLDQPQAEARVRATIGKAYKTLGQNEEAEHHLRRAAERIAGLPNYDSIQHYDVLWSLTHVCFRLERPDALGIAAKARRVAHAHIRESYPELADALDTFIDAVGEAAFGPGGRTVLETLPALFEETCRHSEAVPAGDPLWPLIADCWMAAGYSLWYSPGEEVSEPFYVKALEIQRRELAPNHPQVGETLGQLLGVLNRAGRADQAEQYVRDTLDQLRSVFEPGNFQLAYFESMLGENLVAQGRFEEAEDLLLPAHDVIRETIRDDSKFYVADSFKRIVQLYVSWGREDQAAPFREAIAQLCSRTQMFQPWEILRLAFGPDVPELRAALDGIQAICGEFVVSSSMHLAPEEPLGPWVERALAERARLSPDDPRRIVVARALIAWARVIAPGVMDSAKGQIVRAALRALETDGQIDAPEIAFDVADAHSQLAEIALVDSQVGEAEVHARKAWELLREIYPEDNWITAHAKVRIGRCLVRQGLYDQAEEILLSSYDVLLAQIGAENTDVQAVAELIAEMYTAAGRPLEAESFLATHAAR